MYDGSYVCRNVRWTETTYWVPSREKHTPVV
jgi:hypothetical protein